MYVQSRKSGFGELGPDPGGEAPDPVACLSGEGPLQPGQGYCEGNENVLKLVREIFRGESIAPLDQTKTAASFQKYLLPVGAGVFALLLFSAARGR